VKCLEECRNDSNKKEFAQRLMEEKRKNKIKVEGKESESSRFQKIWSYLNIEEVSGHGFWPSLGHKDGWLQV
jgi:hypothetical protein